MQDALLLHNRHWDNNPFNIPIKRDLLDRLLKFRHSPAIQIISGLRRSGKSSLLKLYINELIKTEDPKSILFVNFDDPNFTAIYNKPERIYDIVELAEKLTGVKVKYLFLDEIQSVSGWEKYVKSVYDADRFEKICITGSNSKLLLGNYSNLLSGRFVMSRMYPLSLAETLSHFNFPDTFSILQERPRVLKLIETCLKHGNFPEIVLQSDEGVKHEVLTNYYDSILIKDCVVNKKLRDSKSFKELAFYIFNNLGVPFSYNSLSKATGINDISVKEYLNAMQEAYMIYEIPQFSFKIKSQIKSKRKLYAIDNGLITATSLNFSENKGRLFENFVFQELLKNGYDGIYFFNDTKECDFIIKNGDYLVAIQATIEFNASNREREINGLLNAKNKLKIPKGIIVTLSQSEQLDKNTIIVPVYELHKNI